MRGASHVFTVFNAFSSPFSGTFFQSNAFFEFIAGFHDVFVPFLGDFFSMEGVIIIGI